MLSHSKKQRSLAQLQGEPVYGSYDRYNFFKVYQKHNPLHVRVSCTRSLQILSSEKLHG